MRNQEPRTDQSLCSIQTKYALNVRNNHWCVVSTVGCGTGVVHVYDSLYKPISKETVCLIASLVNSPSSELRVTMMDVEKQSNGSDCGVLAIAYAFDPESLGLITVRSGHTWQRAFKLSGYRVGECRKKAAHVVCQRRKVMRWQCDVCHVWYHRHCMDIPSEVFGESEVHWECKRCVHE